MKHLILYLVTKSSSDGEITKGDLIWLSENDDLNSSKKSGWLPKEEWDVVGRNDFEVEVCKTHTLRIKQGTETIVRF